MPFTTTWVSDHCYLVSLMMMHSPTQPQIIKKAFSSPLRPIPLHSHSVSSSTPRWQEALQVDIELSALWSYVCRTERRRVRNAEILLARVNLHLKLQNKSRFSAILQLLSYRKHQGNLKKSIEKNLHPSHLNKHPPHQLKYSNTWRYCMVAFMVFYNYLNISGN